jgi:hypothetical protein
MALNCARPPSTFLTCAVREHRGPSDCPSAPIIMDFRLRFNVPCGKNVRAYAWIEIGC